MQSLQPKRANPKNKTRDAQKATLMAMAVPPRKLIIPRPDVLHTYMEHRQINQYLEYIANRYSHFVKLYTLGLSFERREVRALEINWMNSDNVELPPQLRMKSAPALERPFQPGDGPSKGPLINLSDQGRNIVFIEAGTHAREWITITTALNCIYQLAERYTRNIEVLRKLRFFVVPVVNPDGYEYSRTKNRNWRKNRRPHKQTKFVGTDCNRNYDIFWDSGPSKINRNTYKGERPFSEPETRAMRNILDRVEPNLLFFLSLHSYGQSIMYPWGYSRESTHYWRDLHSLANSGRTAIKSYNGREYRTGSISCLNKRTIAGSIVDYVYGVLRAPMALVMELPSRDLGFQPPVEMVSQIGHESWFGIREMCKRAYDLRLIIKRELEPKMPLPPIPPPPAPRLRKSGGEDTPSMQSKHETKIDSATQSIEAKDETSTAKKKTTPKKGKKRIKRYAHENILEIQRRGNMLAKRSSKMGAPLIKRALTASPPAALRSKGGCGDGPVFTGRPKTMPYFPPSLKSNLPLGLFF
ncbi:carboxypeptidase B [Scaptodrosophila lebanonensis]|uniref:Carboxypeptidase B n=1 Tax=Drosophila lebanonensis TaxID=7225 RepID=A0A6J2TUY9_DROLE|nr:carboxypeptidase B [Scaptodrosophila lebanonensis]